MSRVVKSLDYCPVCEEFANLDEYFPYECKDGTWHHPKELVPVVRQSDHDVLVAALERIAELSGIGGVEARQIAREALRLAKEHA